MKARFYIIVTLIFIFCAFFILAYASGYKVDLKERNLSQTGLISIKGDGGQIFVNNELVGESKVVLRNLKPGQYKVEIMKEGYQAWERDLVLDPGEAEIIDDAVLFKANPVVENYETYHEADSEFFSKISDQDGLTQQSGEIYQKGVFVTRFDNEVKGICWYPDQKHIAYTYDNKLKIMDLDGTNNIEITEKKSDSPVVFINSGRSVVFESGGKVYRADIR